MINWGEPKYTKEIRSVERAQCLCDADNPVSWFARNRLDQGQENDMVYIPANETERLIAEFLSHHLEGVG